ncbi:phage tail protein [Providencia manganoxydans]|uniref:phage tail-collar fiber domain-containing protein n=1 Tax=Providencia manganoxydans TaxID=2923283 RepID=UPI0034E46292
MSSVITLEFEHYKAQEAATGKPIILDEFVFALVPNLDPKKPIERTEQLPDVKHIVHRQAINKAGLVSENAVAYSVTLGTEIGDFEFNWIGLLNKASNSVAMITHSPTQKKLRTQGGQQGNVLTRSFLLEFDGAAKDTAINTSAETWQIDFTARLMGIDEVQRLINTDSYGEAAFFGSAFEVTRNGEQYTVNSGLAYVGGLRGELVKNQMFNELRDTHIYVDFSYQGNLLSQWQTVVKLTTSNQLKHYVDSSGYAHFVFAIAAIDKTGTITDLRPQGAKWEQSIAQIKQQYALKSEMKSWRMTAIGGEDMLTPNYAFQSCLLFINGLDQYAAYSFTVENNVIHLAEPLLAGDLVEVLINVPLASQRALMADTETEQLRQDVEVLRNTVNNLKGKDFISNDKKNLVKAGSDEGIYISEDELQHIEEIDVTTQEQQKNK